MEVDREVTILELKKLFIELTEKRPDICIRIRFLGQMWNAEFTRVLSIHESSVTLLDEASNKLYRISNIKSIVQFEIDHGFQIYKPHFHYDVVLSEDEFI